jgi:hypothetical protein
MRAESSPTSLRLVVVLGMHRAGTSAVTGALVQLGYPVGGAALPAADDNPLGYFENAEAVDINEGLLLALGRGWDDLRGLPDGWQASEAAQHARHRIGAWLDGIEAPEGRCVLKDPRLCLLFPLWREVLESRGIDLRVVLAHRALPEIVASLVKRDALAERHALLLTLAHVLEAERGSRGLVRVACHYGAWLDAPADTFGRLVDGLGIGPMDESAIARAVASVDPGQRHHRHDGLPLGGEGLEDLCEAVAEAGFQHGAVPAFDDRFAGRVAEACGESAKTLQPRADALCIARRAARDFATEARSLDAALGETRALALARLSEAERLGDRLRDVDAALADATVLANRRLDEVQALTAALAAARDALARAEALAFARLDSMAVLDASLLETREALARTETLAVERMQRAASLETERDGLQAARDDLAARIALLDRQLAEMRANWAWRLTAPLRWLVSRLSGRAP